MTSSTKKYCAAGIAAKFNDLVLLGRRSKYCHNLAGHWSIPCGMIDKGEDPKSAALREFFEETGVKIHKEISFLDDFKTINDSFFALFYVELEDLIFPSSDAIDAVEHEEWGFFKLRKNSLPLPMTPETRDSLLKLK